MIWGKQKLQREKIDKLHAQWFMTKDYLHMITFYSLSTLHVNPALRTAEKRHFHLERKQYQEFSHFGKEWYSHSFTYAPSAWKLNTIQNSFTDFKKCNADLINGNTGKINTLLDIYKRNENSLQLVFFFPFRLYKLLIFWEKVRISSETIIHWGKDYRMLKIWKTGKSAEQQVVLSKKVLLTVLCWNCSRKRGERSKSFN